MTDFQCFRAQVQLLKVQYSLKVKINLIKWESLSLRVALSFCLGIIIKDFKKRLHRLLEIYKGKRVVQTFYSLILS